MPKRVFWPATLVTMGLIFLASNMGYLPASFWNFWPLILIVVGLGGLVTSDREEWMVDVSKRSSAKKSSSSKPSKASSSSKKSASKKKSTKKKSSKK